MLCLALSPQQDGLVLAEEAFYPTAQNHVQSTSFQTGNAYKAVIHFHFKPSAEPNEATGKLIIITMTCS